MIRFNYLDLLKSMDTVSTFVGSEIINQTLREMSEEALVFMKSLYAQARSDPLIAMAYWPEDLKEVVSDEDMHQIPGRFFLGETDFSAIAWRLSDVLTKDGIPGTFAEKLKQTYLREMEGIPGADNLEILEPKEFRIIVASDDRLVLERFVEWVHRIIGVVLHLIDQDIGLIPSEAHPEP